MYLTRFRHPLTVVGALVLALALASFAPCSGARAQESQSTAEAPQSDDTGTGARVEIADLERLLATLEEKGIKLTRPTSRTEGASGGQQHAE